MFCLIPQISPPPSPAMHVWVIFSFIHRPTSRYIVASVTCKKPSENKARWPLTGVGVLSWRKQRARKFPKNPHLQKQFSWQTKTKKIAISHGITSARPSGRLSLECFCKQRDVDWFVSLNLEGVPWDLLKKTWKGSDDKLALRRFLIQQGFEWVLLLSWWDTPSDLIYK